MAYRLLTDGKDAEGVKFVDDVLAGNLDAIQRHQSRTNPGGPRVKASPAHQRPEPIPGAPPLQAVDDATRSLMAAMMLPQKA